MFASLTVIVIFRDACQSDALEVEVKLTFVANDESFRAILLSTLIATAFLALLLVVVVTSYEATVTELNSRKKVLICTLSIGLDGTPLPETKITQLDQLFKLEEPVPVKDRDAITVKELKKEVNRQHTVECEACNDKKKCKSSRFSLGFGFSFSGSTAF